jgi:hypothetical protein
MRTASFSPATLAAAVTAAGLINSPILAQQIHFSNSTIRLASSAEPAASELAPPVEPKALPETEINFANSTPVVAKTAARESAVVSPPHRTVQPANYTAQITAPPREQTPVNNHSRSIVGVYTSASAQATLSKIPRPAPVQPAAASQTAARAARSRGKPFQTIETDPAVSPYLNLYRTDLNPNTMPNYYALVRPQFEQLEANRKQAADVQRLRKQLQNTAQPVAAPQPAPNGALSGGMSVAARYMDTAQFYRHPHK